MKLIGMLMVTVTLLLLGSTIRVNGQTDVRADWQGHMLAEIAELRVDLMDYLMEWQQSMVLALTRELETVRQEQNRINEEDRQRGQQIAQVEQQLASPELEPPARLQGEAIRAQLMGEAAEKLRSEYTALTQREGEITQRLQRETERGQRLQQKAQQLRSSGARQ